MQYYQLELPGNRLYNKDISIRQFGSEEVESYYVVRRNGSIASLRKLVGNTLKDITVEELYEPDFLFIMYWHRVNSYSNFPYNLPWQCQECSSSNTSKLDLTKIVSPSISDDYQIEGMCLDLPCGLQIMFRLQKETDDVRATEQIKHLGINNPNEGHYRKAELLCMMEPDDNYNAFEKWEFINKLFTPQDIFVIDGFKQTFKYGPSNVMDCTCKGCGESRRVSFRFSILEFFPTDSDLTDIRTRILSNKPSKDSAKRAKEAALSKVNMVTAKASIGIGKPAESKDKLRDTVSYKPVEAAASSEVTSAHEELAKKVLADAISESGRTLDIEVENDLPPTKFTRTVGGR